MTRHVKACIGTAICGAIAVACIVWNFLALILGIAVLVLVAVAVIYSMFMTIFDDTPPSRGDWP